MITKTQAIKAFPIVGKHHFLGKGFFSAVFKESPSTVLVVSDDPAKECLALGWMPDSSLLPTIERLEYGIEGLSLYRMPLYNTFRAPKRHLNKKGYSQYSDFLSLRWKIASCQKNWDLISILEEIPTDNAYLLSQCIDSMSSYTDQCGFEISPRNIASDKDGNLILLDCFFDKARIVSKINSYC